MFAKLTIAYDGACYFGFQKQAGLVRTVSGTIEDTLARIYKQKLCVIGAGRTDRGVHATGQVIGFEMPYIIEPASLKKALVSLLPETIDIVDISFIQKRFHPIQDAVSREYHYCMTTDSDIPIYLKPYLAFFSGLNKRAFSEVLSLFCGRHNFSAFCSNKKDMHQTDCDIYEIALNYSKKKMFQFDRNNVNIICVKIVGKSFLYKMIRHIIGASVACVEKRLTKQEIVFMLGNGNRIKSWPIAPAKGLYLSSVKYK